MDVPLLTAQHGVFHRSQTRDVGRSAPGGRPHAFRVLPAVYSVLPPPLSFQARWWAAQLYTGRDAALAGLDAAAVHAWIRPDTSCAVRTYVPAENRRASVGFVDVHRTRVPLWQDVGGLRVLDPARAVIDVASLVPERRLLAIMTTAIQRRDVTVQRVLDLIDAHRRLPGAREARAAAVLLAGGAESITELDLASLGVRGGLPDPITQVDVFDGKEYVTTIDLMWLERLVAAYYDGRTHLAYETQDADSIISLRLRGLGLSPVRVTAGGLRSPQIVVDALRAAYDDGRHALPSPRLRLRHRGKWLDLSRSGGLRTSA